MLSNPSLHIAAKIYATSGLTQEDAQWIADRVDLLVGDGSLNPIATALKTANPGILLARYVTTPLVATSSTFQGTVPEGNIPTEHPDWIWMWNPNGDPERIWNTPSRYYILPNSDAGSPVNWPAYWVERVLEFIGVLPFDAVHGDIAVQYLWQFQLEDREKLAQHYGGDSALFQADQEPHIIAIKSGINAAGLLLLLNNFGINNPYFLGTRRYNLDGLNHQYIFTTFSGGQLAYQAPSTVETLMGIIDLCKADGKICMLASAIGADPPWDLDLIKYCVHAQMLVSQHPYTYLNLDPAEGGSWEHLQTLFTDYAEAFETDFGQPTGERYEEEGVWKRYFTNGLLEIDLVNHTYSFTDTKPQPPTILGSGFERGAIPERVPAVKSPELNLKQLAEDYYGSAHYLFMLLKQNSLSLASIQSYSAADLNSPVLLMRSSPASLIAGQTIELPPKGLRKGLSEAERRRKQTTYIPI